VEYLRPPMSQARRYFADALKQIEGIQPLDRNTRKVLGVVTGQNPQNPWVNTKQIIKKTGLAPITVNRNLTSLLESGLVIEYSRPRKNPGRTRYFADARTEIKGIKPPLDRNTQKVLGVVRGLNPRNPWINNRQIVEKTGLSPKTVVTNLTSLLEAGLVVEHPREREREQQHRKLRYFADPLKPVEGIEPLDSNTQKVLDLVMGQNPRNPWVSRKQIIEKTGLARNTVDRNLTSLLEAGLVVEHPREREGQQQRRRRRYFADVLKEIAGIEPQEQEDLEPEEQDDLEYVPQVSLSQQEAVLVAFLMALKRGNQWLKRDQIGGFDDPVRYHLRDIKFNELSELLELLIQEKLVRSKVEGQHKYFAPTPVGIQSAQTINKRTRVGRTT
jgi:DNA-binding transcriptional ArsR family regulator